MKNFDSTSEQIVAKLQEIAQEVFNTYANRTVINQCIPAGGITVTDFYKSNPRSRYLPTIAGMIQVEIKTEAEERFGKEPNTYKLGYFERELPQWQKDENTRHAKWLQDTGINTTIEVGTCKLSFCKWDVFKFLEQYARMCRCTPSLKKFNLIAA